MSDGPIAITGHYYLWRAHNEIVLCTGGGTQHSWTGRTVVQGGSSHRDGFVSNTWVEITRWVDLGTECVIEQEWGL